MSETDLIFSGNENLMLHFDDDGEELQAGDRVIVNHEHIALIGQVDGKRTLVGWPADEIVHHIELITEPHPVGTDWPDSV